MTEHSSCRCLKKPIVSESRKKDKVQWICECGQMWVWNSFFKKWRKK